MPRRSRPFVAGALLSLGAHLAIALMLLRLPAPAASESTPVDPNVEVEVDPAGTPNGTPGARARGNAPHEADDAEAGGARSAQNIDARDRGEGGDARGAVDGILLMNRAEGILLFDSPLNNLAAAQTQRIRTARDRATLERRRATPHPDDDVFLASGQGSHQERRPVSASDATAGARVAPVASLEGAMPSIARVGATGIGSEGAIVPGGDARSLARASSASGAESGTSAPSPGVGILGGSGARHSEAANVAHARPSVDEGPAATHAAQSDSRVRDNAESEQLVRSMFQSWVDSTTRTGRQAGEGRGGVGGGGTPGVGGGRREGGRASSFGPGDGPYAALDTSDGRYRRWFLESRRRVRDAMRFPRERALAMDQGVTVVSLEVRRDGTLAAAPRITRHSGYDDLDRAALAAIEAATPFSPLPADIAPGLDRLALTIPIDFSNPMVR